MARTPKLPAPPLPAALKTPPPRPGEGNGKLTPVDHAKEGGTSVVGWVDERTSLSGGTRWLLFRKVPKGTNWFYTLGSATTPTKYSSGSSCAGCTSGDRA